MTRTKKSVDKVKTEKNKVTPENIAAIGVSILLCIFPLFLPNRYLKMTIGKLIFFMVVAFSMFIVLNLNFLSTSQTLKKSDFFRKNPHELSLLCFLGFGVITCLASGNITNAVTGAQGRFMGLITLFALAAVFFAISRFFRGNVWVFYAFASATVILNVIALIQYVGFDPFSLYEGMSEKTHYSFISTLGNQNMYSAYLCLIVPFFVIMSIKAEKRLLIIFSCVALFLGFVGMFVAKSDGAYIGLALAFFFTFIAAAKNKKNALSALHCFLMFFLASGLIYVANSIDAFTCFRLTYFSQILTKPIIFATGIALCTVLILITRFVKATEKLIAIASKILIILCIIAVIAAAAAFCYFTFFDTQTDLGNFEELLRFNDKWGTDRGYIWKYVWKLFSRFSFSRKLLGCGEDCLYSTFCNAFGKSVAAVENGSVDNAHCDYLHLLVTQGILGLFSYLAFIFFVLKKAMASSSYINKAAACACVGYLLQATVNIWQPITTPLLFVFLAIAISDIKIPAVKKDENNLAF